MMRMRMAEVLLRVRSSALTPDKIMLPHSASVAGAGALAGTGWRANLSATVGVRVVSHYQAARLLAGLPSAVAVLKRMQGKGTGKGSGAQSDQANNENTGSGSNNHGLSTTAGPAVYLLLAGSMFEGEYRAGMGAPEGGYVSGSRCGSRCGSGFGSIYSVYGIDYRAYL